MPTKHRMTWDILAFSALLLVGALLAYIDNRLGFLNILVESVHALLVTALLVFALVCQVRYPDIRHFGWNRIVLGIAFLMVGSWIDILDDPPMLEFFHIAGTPFGRSWQQAFVKKILGYSAGIGLIAYGFFTWIPWMVETRLNVQRLNQRLSQANQNMNRILMSLDEHVESERLTISRELHDDVAQRLTFLNVQVQLCQKAVDKGREAVLENLRAIGQEISEVLRRVRQVSRDLRPEPLYALGLVPALEQFIDKTLNQLPEETKVEVNYQPLPDGAGRVRLESRFDERELLHLYRILQEGIRNALRHGRALHVSLAIVETLEAFRFVLADNGAGLPWKTMPLDTELVQEGHLGIAGMKERVNELSGSFCLENRQDGPGAIMEIEIAK